MLIRYEPLSTVFSYSIQIRDRASRQKTLRNAIVGTQHCRTSHNKTASVDRSDAISAIQYAHGRGAEFAQYKMVIFAILNCTLPYQTDPV